VQQTVPQTDEPQAARRSAFGLARDAWRSLPIPVGVRGAVTSTFYRFAPPVRRRVEAEVAERAFQSRRAKVLSELVPGPLVLSGFMSDVTGIGRAGRMTLGALKAAGYRPIVHDLRRDPRGEKVRAAKGGVWLAHCNAPEAAYFVMQSGLAEGRYRIGYWAWELPDLPADWAKVAPLFHELWAPSEFVADAIRRGTARWGIPVKVVPHPLPEVTDVVSRRTKFAVPDGAFAFLSMYDVRSTAARKNPMGAIEAFQKAFAPDRWDVVLLVKVVAAHESISCLNDLKRRCAGWDNIQIIEEHLSDADADALIASADVFVSLHRSEGFGLSIAQAMAMGRTALVTDWSGNVDFAQAGVVRISYLLVPVNDPSGRYHMKDQVWAEPDLDVAVKAMVELADTPGRSEALGRTAKAQVGRVLPTAFSLEHLKAHLARSAYLAPAKQKGRGSAPRPSRKRS
jgi:glycosyltransferase involved in cell wall biosynthesis